MIKHNVAEVMLKMITVMRNSAVCMLHNRHIGQSLLISSRRGKDNLNFEFIYFLKN